MTLYNVRLTLECTMVVQAGDEEEAVETARNNWKDALSDCDPDPSISVTGEVTNARHLRDGWCDMCQPYGGDQRIADILKQTQGANHAD